MKRTSRVVGSLSASTLLDSSCAHPAGPSHFLLQGHRTMSLVTGLQSIRIQHPGWLKRTTENSTAFLSFREAQCASEAYWLIRPPMLPPCPGSACPQSFLLLVRLSWPFFEVCRMAPLRARKASPSTVAMGFMTQLGPQSEACHAAPPRVPVPDKFEGLSFCWHTRDVRTWTSPPL